MVEITRPMILRIGTPNIDKDMKKVKELLISAGYHETEEGKFVHNQEEGLTAQLQIDAILDKQGKPLQDVIEVILSDADSYINQTIYNALATVFPLNLSK
ncbi:MAG: hypothetical protein U9O98_04355 [Asgard group archaeon]|nr:hypothetical protein [Asgard group archaeon]